jgi:hypothetical protein
MGENHSPQLVTNFPWGPGEVCCSLGLSEMSSCPTPLTAFLPDLDADGPRCADP